ncbi:aspartyl-phosphate phosphatase Spo0E family protein [Lederbergia lenta]|uniref:Sporulation stage 0, Spo0E-like regulatory phosphatase n=1 Tax=Lederbergia lenta TaxID=1467 RepID=A0A2X4VGU1_LEDLE|nr:aspartyl-phosphate phosphatase Spo0E family protein [Lederbergia lenta]MCM3112752.1 aspartyl-phosphate phosphatase Spo0E family protein [Lederbergia lenta]MEC2323786.1 aspartyl-phosphate phosphatase Spo0E family protein [Lederbergia lenta]SQI51426.1 Sporulation stage 0, Spo0E-like regulatory phosphatase [Lederbergia lenta]
MSKEDLLLKIEKNRQEMVELGLAFSFIDERVIRISDHLDKLLNMYQALTIDIKRQ